MVELGIKGVLEDVVSETMTASHIGSGTVKVLATPMMIALMEKCCRTAVKPYLEEGQETVGTLVNVSHQSATPVGMAIKAECELVETDRRRLTFKVAMYDERGLVGEGLHERFIIDVAKFSAKVNSK